MIFTRSGAHDRIRKVVKEPDKQCNEILDKVVCGNEKACGDNCTMTFAAVVDMITRNVILPL